VEINPEPFMVREVLADPASADEGVMLVIVGLGF
jgi:hypothetical protein